MNPCSLCLRRRTAGGTVRRFGFALGAALAFVWASGTLAIQAEVVRFEIASRGPYAGGMSFGETGPYEQIVGRVHFEIDPVLPQNEPIVDLALAPRNERGRVEFWSDLVILTPADGRRGNGTILYDVNNRGNKLALGFFNNGGGLDPGDGFLMRQGFTVVWSGWNGELLPGNDRLRLSPPVARQANGEPITGLVRCEIVPTRDTTRSSVAWENHGSYRPTHRGFDEARLTQRERAADERRPVPRDQFSLHVRDVASDSPTQLPLVELEFPAGMKAGWIYELVYEARDPLVHGVCFASVRDLVSSLKHGTGAAHPLAGTAAEPRFRQAIGFGVSQSGRFLREFVFSGFNEDERGGIVFDGVIPLVSGAGLGSFNHRFAQPTRHVQQHDHHDYPADRFPFAYETQTDPLTGQTGGILDRARRRGTVPKLFHAQSAGEYWTRSGSLAHTDPTGSRDSELPPEVRVYLFGGTQHGPAAFPPPQAGQNLANPGNYKPLLRALLVAMQRWVADGTPPPPSRYPTIASGTLVDWTQASTGFPAIPGVRYPEVIQQPDAFDYGPRWHTEGIIDHQPPRPGPSYRVLVPRVGADGNELGCLLPPEVAVPVATYTGWNLRRSDQGAEGELVSLTGSCIPLARTKAERTEKGDPRWSLEERYGTFEAYCAALRSECARLVRWGYLLPDDAEAAVRIHSERARAVFAGN